MEAISSVQNMRYDSRGRERENLLVQADCPALSSCVWARIALKDLERDALLAKALRESEATDAGTDYEDVWRFCRHGECLEAHDLGCRRSSILNLLRGNYKDLRGFLANILT